MYIVIVYSLCSNVNAFISLLNHSEFDQLIFYVIQFCRHLEEVRILAFNVFLNELVRAVQSNADVQQYDIYDDVCCDKLVIRLLLICDRPHASDIVWRYEQMHAFDA